MVGQQIIARCLRLRAGPVVNSNTPAAFAAIRTVSSFRPPSCRVDRGFLVAFGPRVPPSPRHLFVCHSPASVCSAVPARCPTLPCLLFVSNARSILLVIDQRHPSPGPPLHGHASPRFLLSCLSFSSSGLTLCPQCWPPLALLAGALAQYSARHCGPASRPQSAPHSVETVENVDLSAQCRLSGSRRTASAAACTPPQSRPYIAHALRHSRRRPCSWGRQSLSTRLPPCTSSRRSPSFPAARRTGGVGHDYTEARQRGAPGMGRTAGLYKDRGLAEISPANPSIKTTTFSHMQDASNVKQAAARNCRSAGQRVHLCTQRRGRRTCAAPACRVEGHRAHPATS